MLPKLRVIYFVHDCILQFNLFLHGKYNKINEILLIQLNKDISCAVIFIQKLYPIV